LYQKPVQVLDHFYFQFLTVWTENLFHYKINIKQSYNYSQGKVFEILVPKTQMMRVIKTKKFKIDSFKMFCSRINQEEK